MPIDEPTCPVCGHALYRREERDTIIYSCPDEKYHSHWASIPFEFDIDDSVIGE